MIELCLNFSVSSAWDFFISFNLAENSARNSNVKLAIACLISAPELPLFKTSVSGCIIVSEESDFVTNSQTVSSSSELVDELQSKPVVGEALSS